VRDSINAWGSLGVRGGGKGEASFENPWRPFPVAEYATRGGGNTFRPYTGEEHVCQCRFHMRREKKEKRGEGISGSQGVGPFLTFISARKRGRGAASWRGGKTVPVLSGPSDQIIILGGGRGNGKRKKIEDGWGGGG